MLKKELAALKVQLVSQEKMLSKQAAEAGEGDAPFKNYFLKIIYTTGQHLMCY